MRRLVKVYHRRLSSSSNIASPLPRSQKGSQISEFAAALMLLVTVVFIPLLDLAIVPVRWMMAQELINSYVRTLAMCESFSESIRTEEADPSLQTRLLKLGGVDVKTMRLHLNITRVSKNRDTVEYTDIDKPASIPAEWLPDGALAPCVYLLKIDIEALISPAILLKWEGMTVPGLTAPIPLMLTASHEWVNLGRDPTTEKYFINE
jgi:hypothetical protein